MAMVIGGGSVTGLTGAIIGGNLSVSGYANVTQGLTTASRGVNPTSVPAGTVLQVVAATKTDTQLFASSSSFSDITGLSVTITPNSSTSKFLIGWSVAAGNGADGSHFYTRLQRNGSNILVADSASSRTGASGIVINTGPSGSVLMNSSSYLDSPATTSALTYKLQGTSNWTGGGSSYVNRSVRDTDQAGYDGRSTSSIFVMEIAQ